MLLPGIDYHWQKHWVCVKGFQVDRFVGSSDLAETATANIREMFMRVLLGGQSDIRFV